VFSFLFLLHTLSTGTGTGGVEEFAAAEGMHIHMIDYHSGGVNYVYIGGSAELGHTGVVTCVLLDGKLLFSGSTDENIIAWSTDDDRKIVRRFVGHEGSIVSLAVEGTFLASGGSDSTLRLWDKHTGEYDVLDVFVVCAVYACVCVCVCVCCVVFVVCA